MALQGITDLYGQRASGYTGAGALESRRGLPGYGPVDDPYGQGSRGQWGDVAGPAWAAPGWNATLRRQANEDVYTTSYMLEDDTDVEGQGMGSVSEQPDQTPYPATRVAGYSGRGRHTGYEELGSAPDPGIASHAGPYPRTWLQAGRLRPEPGTGIDDQWTEQEARRITHEGGYGAEQTGYTSYVDPQDVHRRDVYYESRGSSLLQAPGSQLRYAPDTGGPNMARGHRDNSTVTADEVQGGGVPNSHGFGGAHIQNYRQQTDPVPFNFQWLDASERPFIPKGQQTNMYAAQTLDGPDSPYGVMGDQTDYSAQLFGPAMVEGPATAYQAPADPTMNQAGNPDDGEDVWAYG